LAAGGISTAKGYKGLSRKKDKPFSILSMDILSERWIMWRLFIETYEKIEIFEK
jgi:hypothetical protein